MRVSTVSVHNHGATYVCLNDAHQVPVAYLFENSSAAGCTNAGKQERLSLTVANLHEMCVNGGKSMLNHRRQHGGSFALQLDLCQQMWLDTSAVTINLT